MRIIAGSVRVLLIFVLFCCAGYPSVARGFVVGDLEKPKPEFTYSGDQITAKLIPRAKSTSILIHFKVSGGRLITVNGVDFETAKRPEADVKNFKSALFEIKIGEMAAGAEARVSILSDFFTRSTGFYVFNLSLQKPWMNSQAENLTHTDRVEELVVTVKDGGPFDSDGAANGQITLVGGPWDSFWGYALGTLFIRFFGIFIVLSILMIGLLVTGKIFKMIQNKKIRAPLDQTGRTEERPLSEIHTQTAGEGPGQLYGIPPEDAAAAIAVAVHMHFAALHASEPLQLSCPHLNSWTLDGRNRTMNDRFLVFNRCNRRSS